MYKALSRGRGILRLDCYFYVTGAVASFVRRGDPTADPGRCFAAAPFYFVVLMRVYLCPADRFWQNWRGYLAPYSGVR